MLTVLKSMLHLAMQASPPVPGAMTSGYFLSSVKVDSGMPVAALRTVFGICIRDAQMVWVPASRMHISVSNDAVGSGCAACVTGTHSRRLAAERRGAILRIIGLGSGHGERAIGLRTGVPFAEVGEELGWLAGGVVREVDDACMVAAGEW